MMSNTSLVLIILVWQVTNLFPISCVVNVLIVVRQHRRMQTYIYGDRNVVFKTYKLAVKVLRCERMKTRFSKRSSTREVLLLVITVPELHKMFFWQRQIRLLNAKCRTYVYYKIITGLQKKICSLS